MKFILAQVSGPTLNLCESKGNYTPLILATHLQNEDIVRTLIETCEHKNELLDWTKDEEIVISDTERYVPLSTALHVAILSENINIINILLSAGASCWIDNQNGESSLELAQKARNVHDIMSIFCDPLHFHVHSLFKYGNRVSKTIQLLNILFENGVDVNSYDREGFPLLYNATEIGTVATMKYLILRGADINVLVSHTCYSRRYYNNMAALHVTAKTVNAEKMSCLLEGGADVNLRNGNGHTPIHNLLCTTMVLYTSRHRLAIIDCCELLIQHGARVNTVCDVGHAPLLDFHCHVTKMCLAIYVISAGGCLSFHGNLTRLSVPVLLNYIPKQHLPLFLEFIFESGFSTEECISALQDHNSELVSQLSSRQQNPRSLKRLSANVIRNAMVPNAWVGLKGLPLPPAFDKQYIISHPKQIVSILNEQL